MAKINLAYRIPANYTIKKNNEILVLPDPKKLNESELSDMIIDVYVNPEPYKKVRVIEKLSHLKNGKGKLYGNTEFKPKDNPYWYELIKK